MPRSSAGFTVWLTGLPCSGKTTLAGALAALLDTKGVCAELLDGDVMRRHLSPELGFSRAERDAHVARVGFLAELLNRHGVAVIAALVSPYAEARARLRRRLPRFVEVHLDCSPAACERRDTRGLYARARAGTLSGLTGVDSPYERPEQPELRLDTERRPAAECAERVLELLVERGLVP
jgi:adenylyl-sulfate kinase